MKRLVFCLVFGCAAVLSFCREFKKTVVPAPFEYAAYVAPYDFAGCIEKVVLNAGREILEADVNVLDFDFKVCLYSSKNDEGESGENVVPGGIEIVKSHKKIAEAYLSDSLGLPSVSRTSRFITLKLAVSPEDYASPFETLPFLNDEKFCTYRIENSKLNLNISTRAGIACPDACAFTTGTFVFEDEESPSADEEAEKISLEYAHFVPQKSSDSAGRKIPLIVFFHGMNESGTDIAKPLYSIKTTALTKKQIQSHFGENGAAVLLPQCPTGWLEITEKDPFGNRLWAVTDINKPLRRASKAINDFLEKKLSVKGNYVEESSPVSYYTPAVKALIDDFIKNNPQIDTSRIYVGGCSAGGFMCLNMMIQYPDFFAAGFPICEAFPDERICNSDIEKLASKPLWFTLSLNDETVKPEKNTLPTVERLKSAGAGNLHSKYFVKVADTTGKFKNEDGEPFEYEGHCSWIYLFNDEISDGNLNLFDWLALQRNGK